MWRDSLYSLEIENLRNENVVEFWEGMTMSANLVNHMFLCNWAEDAELLDFSMGRTDNKMHVAAIPKICEYFDIKFSAEKISGHLRQCEKEAWSEGVQIRQKLYSSETAKLEIPFSDWIENEFAKAITYRLDKIDLMTRCAEVRMKVMIMSQQSDPKTRLQMEAMWEMFRAELVMQKSKLEGISP